MIFSFSLRLLDSQINEIKIYFRVTLLGVFCIDSDMCGLVSRVSLPINLRINLENIGILSTHEIVVFETELFLFCIVQNSEHFISTSICKLNDKYSPISRSFYININKDKHSSPFNVAHLKLNYFIESGNLFTYSLIALLVGNFCFFSFL